ncbi:hypothetical protein [Verrucomicrobium sp. GAS474]|uniref:hypothetical protein n=1 Tax=Verrucomicrobium sp. GAS474 TaxID=1882831 RepID=UPI0012FF9D0A|nr:hypothetical protein [Verrucomicrobium sp. GAS474]
MVLTLAVSVGAFSSLLAQSDDVSLKFKEGSDGLKAEFVDPPSGGAVGGSTGYIDSRKWLKIDAQYMVNTPNEVLPEAKFKVYVEVYDLQKPRDSRGDKVAILTGEATYVNLPNVPSGRELHVTFFVHPYTINRFGGEKNFHFEPRQNIHIDAYAGEQKIASKDAFDVPAADKNWYQSESERKISGMILTREQSPWSMSDTITYPQAKLKASAAE